MSDMPVCLFGHVVADPIRERSPRALTFRDTPHNSSSEVNIMTSTTTPPSLSPIAPYLARAHELPLPVRLGAPVLVDVDHRWLQRRADPALVMRISARSQRAGLCPGVLRTVRANGFPPKWIGRHRAAVRRARAPQLPEGTAGSGLAVPEAGLPGGGGHDAHKEHSYISDWWSKSSLCVAGGP